MRQRQIRPEARQTGCADAGRHARAGRRDRRLCAGMRDGRACGEAQARSARAAAALLLGSRPERRHALQQQETARVLRAGGAGFRLGEAQSGAALDARRQRTGRLGHGDRHLGSHADEDRGAHRAHRERPCRSLVRDRRHRHRHLHHHDAACRRHARPAAGECHRAARRFQFAAIAGRGRLVGRGLSGGCDRRRGREGAQGVAAAREEDEGLAARRARSWKTSRCATAS